MVKTECGHDFENSTLTCTKCKENFVLCHVCVIDRVWQKNTQCESCNKIKDIWSHTQFFTEADKEYKLNCWLKAMMFTGIVIMKIYIMEDKIKIVYFKNQNDCNEYIMKMKDSGDLPQTIGE